MLTLMVVVRGGQEWHAFEVAHGNEDTFKEMLRVKRSVVNQFALANIATEELLRKAELQAAQQRAIQESAKKSLEAVAALRAGAPRPPPPPPSASLEEAPSSKKRSRPADIDIINEVCLRWFCVFLILVVLFSCRCC
jgi:hypothetical protein